jgi:hypothetical protein
MSRLTSAMSSFCRLVLHDMREHVADFFQRRLFGHVDPFSTPLIDTGYRRELL